MVKAERCKACGLCIQHCPKKCIKLSETLNNAGYHPVVVDEKECIVCGACYVMCPDGVHELHAD